MSKRSQRANSPQKAEALPVQGDSAPLIEILGDFAKEKKLPPELMPELVEVLSSQLCSMTLEQRFSGPMPDPDTLRKYEAIIPGMAKEHWNELLEEGKTDRHCKKVYTWSVVLGQLIGFALGAGGLLVGYLLAKSGADTAGIIAILSGVGTIVGSICGKYLFNKK